MQGFFLLFTYTLKLSLILMGAFSIFKGSLEIAFMSVLAYSSFYRVTRTLFANKYGYMPTFVLFSPNNTYSKITKAELDMWKKYKNEVVFYKNDGIQKLAEKLRNIIIYRATEEFLLVFVFINIFDCVYSQKNIASLIVMSVISAIFFYCYIAIRSREK